MIRTKESGDQVNEFVEVQQGKVTDAIPIAPKSHCDSHQLLGNVLKTYEARVAANVPGIQRTSSTTISL
jgi:hypothetical protein